MGAIEDMFSLDHRLYLIAERGVSSGIFADQIDPERQDINIPQIVQQPVLHYGTESVFIQQTLCATKELLNHAIISREIEVQPAMRRALAIAVSLAAVFDAVAAFKLEEAAVRERLAGQVRRDHLPHTPNLKGRAEQAIFQLWQAQQEVVRLGAAFYPVAANQRSWSEVLAAAVLAQLGPQHEFIPILDDCLALMRGVNDVRNAVVHPDQTKAVSITDYDLVPGGGMVAPTISVRHPHLDLDRRDLVQFLEQSASQLGEVYECLLAWFCECNRTPMPMFESHVEKLPDGQLIHGSRMVWRTVRVEPRAHPLQAD